MKKFGLFIGCACLFYGVISERISVEKCLSYSQADYVKNESESNECYLPGIQKVQDGTPAAPKQFPHTAIIGYVIDDDKVTWACMGSLISENYIVTAGHCISFKNSYTGKPTLVRLGDFKQSPDGVESQELEIAESSIHPDFDPKLHLNDIALIKLKEPAKLNVFVRPTCLYPKTDTSVTKGLYSGRNGDDSSSQVEKVTLRQVLAEILPNSRCLEVYPNNGRKGFFDDGSQFCASTRRGEEEHCRGESGSSLVLESQTPCMFELYGFVVSGKACGRIEYPDVYTKIPHYLDWIEKNVWP